VRWLLLLLLLPVPAHAEWLPDLPRAVTQTDLADPEAPVSAYAFGPRGHLQLGGEAGLLRWPGRTDIRLGVQGLGALDDAVDKAVLPDQLLRWNLGIYATFAWQCPDRTWELTTGLTRSQSRTLGDFLLPGGAPPHGIPFGAGGLSLDVAVASHGQHGPWHWTAVARERLHLPGLLEILGQREAADVLADFLADGLSHAPSLDLAVRYALTPGVQPLLAIHGVLDVPVDASAHWTGLARVLAGVVLGAWTPHVAVEAGSGPGLLVNRHEVRLSIGVRHATP
jgi:hypothetical protein